MSKTFVQFGAGNIGRSFLGQLFSRGGYEIVFVDVDETLIHQLNEENAYRIVIKHPDGTDEIISIDNVRAVNGLDDEAVAEVIADCDLAATAVGARALGHVAPTLAKGLMARRRRGRGTLDIILAENLQGAASFLKEALSRQLTEDFDIDRRVGLIETSIGKMVPIMRHEDLEIDPLWVFAEPYNTLIVDAKAFRNPVPNIDGLKPVDNIAAYVDRKLFIHNLGHSATAYLGYEKEPHWDYIWEVLEDDQIASTVRRAMRQSSEALLAEYPETFSKSDLAEHVEDLLARFRNKALGDTIHRVGRDLYRKLGRRDRLVGALLLVLKHDREADAIARAVRAAVQFEKSDEKGELFPADREFAEKEKPLGLQHILRKVCELAPENPLDTKAINAILNSKGQTACTIQST
ncbi:MAG: mannitol-1-phosphate 5-dehydrogenase [Candidatus Sumerlaeota bacterium]